MTNSLHKVVLVFLVVGITASIVFWSMLPLLVTLVVIFLCWQVALGLEDAAGTGGEPRRSRRRSRRRRP